MRAKSKIKHLFNETKSIKSIDLACKATSIIERLLWVVVGLSGIGWAVWFIPDQFQLWADNPTIITRDNAKLSDIRYPAITIMPPGTSKYGIGERLGNYINPENMPRELYKIRNLYLKCMMIFKHSQTVAWSKIESQDLDFFYEYDMDCISPSPYKSPGPAKEKACKVSLINLEQ